MHETDYVVVLTTLPEDADATALGRALVEERLAACVNVLAPMESMYRWQGAVEQARERQLLIKTSRRRIVPLAARLRALHPYELPEFVVLAIADGSDAYLRWLGESTAPPAP
jgi:periplasmic divalent cation tolerance protein